MDMMNPQHQIFNSAIELHQSGNLDEAFDLYTSIYNVDSDQPQLLYHMGMLRYQQEMYRDAGKYLTKTIRFQPDNFDAQLILGLNFFKQDQLIKAKKHISLASKIKPSNIDAINYLIIISLMNNAWEEADKLIGKAASIHGSDLNAYANLSHTYEQLFGSEVVVRNKISLSFVLINILFRDKEFNKCYQKIMTSTVDEGITYLTKGKLNKLFRSKLLLRILKTTVVTSVEFEIFLTKVRKIMLHHYVGNDSSINHVDKSYWMFVAVMAEYIWLIEYVFTVTDQELSIIDELKNKISLQDNKNLEPKLLHDYLIAFSYMPLNKLSKSENPIELNIKGWPDFTQELLDRFKEYYDESKIKLDIQSLSPINDSISSKVQQQYEEHPYPRWKSFKKVDETKHSFGELIKASNQSTNISEFLSEPVKMLIAGCGTGQEVINYIMRMNIAELLAIDLSKSSLAYAIRKANEMNVADKIKFRHADILELNNKNLMFDVISSSGVLHHMKEPLEGWRVLTKMLRPGGLMRIALYSKRARESITKAREVIAKNKLEGTVDNMKKYRQEIFDNDIHPLKNLQHSSDFFVTSTFRDLLFHEQEHCFSIPMIKNCLEELGLKLIGLSELNKETGEKYRQMFPDDPSGLNLDNWEIYEAQYPNTFANMYHMYLIKK
jgi:2-polyprenyl-3-methyl-5-hydroxy-6-metoxy-1,4-benzoquinol methylase